jgi:DNA-binding response OmpR family regulator
MTGSRVLVVEDDPSIGHGLTRALTDAGYTAELAPDAAHAEALADHHAPDLVVLDLGLPDGDGIELCGRLRQALPSTVILILTARSEEIDVVVGLDAGADDYVVKPFSLAELLARIRAHLRRRPATDDTPTLVESGNITVDLAARRVFVAGSEIDLRPREFDLLALLFSEEGSVVRREDIMSQVWDEHWFGSTKTLDVHLVALRRKLGDEASRITTIRGVGYRLERP